MGGGKGYAMVEFGPFCAFSLAPWDCVQLLREQSKILLVHLPLAVFFVQAPGLYHHHPPRCLQVLEPFYLLC
jgi:hypothetical protein